MKHNHQSFIQRLALALTFVLSANTLAASDMRGDVDDDGSVNIADVTVIIDYILTNGVSINEANADVERDGSINIADVTMLIDYILGGITFAPDEEEFNVNGVTFTMMPVEGGTFMMGATAEQGSDGNERERPVHQVTLDTYFIGQTEVTQALWVAVMGHNPSYFVGEFNPVENVSWEDCQQLNRPSTA